MNEIVDLKQNFQNNEYNQNGTMWSPFFAIKQFSENCGYLNLKLIKKITELVWFNVCMPAYHFNLYFSLVLVHNSVSLSKLYVPSEASSKDSKSTESS